MKNYYVSLLVTVLFLTACQPDIPIVSSGLDDTYVVTRMRALRLHPEYSGERYEWTMLDVEGNDSIVSTNRDFIFISANTGIYSLRLRIIDAENPFEHNMLITVWNEEIEYSPYISHVYEYHPAPGQYVGELPRYESGDTEETMRAKVENCITGDNDELISLGGFGGYIVFGFDHSIVNKPNSPDFKILGNAFYAQSNPTASNPNSGGSAEPGIVMVAFDNNGNGKPDDIWYELAGSEHNNPATIRNYMITYHRTPADHIATPKPNSGVVDTTYIAWEDNYGNYGYISRNAFHTQEYFPQWLSNEQLCFTGTRLPDNATDPLGDGSLYVLNTYEWGYADNHPNNSDKCAFDIDWAIDNEGNPIYLPCIDFIRVYTGVNQQCGRIGETSTEICRAQDLHVEEL